MIELVSDYHISNMVEFQLRDLNGHRIDLRILVWVLDKAYNEIRNGVAGIQNSKIHK